MYAASADDVRHGHGLWPVLGDEGDGCMLEALQGCVCIVWVTVGE